MARCEVCGKGAGHGNNVSHSKRHTRRRWLPNVHRKQIDLGGVSASVKICTRCLRTIQKVEKAKA